MSINNHSGKGSKIHHGRRAEPPETRVIEGTSKRNILRKGKMPKCRKESSAGHMIKEISEPVIEIELEKDDPDYGSQDEEEDDMFADRDDDCGLAIVKLTLTKYKKLVEPIIKEYFICGDIDDFAKSIVDIDCLDYGYELVKRSVNMSFDKGDRERELVSKALSYMHPSILSTSIVGKGFERLFEIIDEVEKDAPGAHDMLSKFLARTVYNEVLPPSFLSDPVVCNLGGDVVEHAKRMLTREHAGSLLECCWGPGDGRPVEELKIAVDLLLQEYILSNDILEATRCISELKVSHFYHEIVKRAVVQAMDKSIESQTSMSKLLVHLKNEGYLDSSQIVVGFNRLYNIVDDLELDTPAAKAILDSFTSRAIEDGILPLSYAELRHISVDTEPDAGIHQKDDVSQ